MITDTLRSKYSQKKSLRITLSTSKPTLDALGLKKDALGLKKGLGNEMIQIPQPQYIGFSM